MSGQIVICPRCQAKYRTSAQPGQRLQCPKCKAVVVIPSASTPSVSGAGAVPSGGLLGQQTYPRRPVRGKNAALDPELFPFVKRLGIVIGAVCAVIVATAVGGFFSEPVAVVATIIGLVATLGLVLAGRIWFVVIAFKESATLGVATIFVPLFWAYCLAKRLERSQLAFALLVSGLIPAIVTSGFAFTFQARYTPEGRAAGRVARYAQNAANMVEVIRKHESQSPPTGEPREVSYSCPDRMDDPVRFLSSGDQGLSQFTGYVEGSLRFDEARRQISFQCRGTDTLADQYRLYLVFLTSTPIGARVSGN